MPRTRATAVLILIASLVVPAAASAASAAPWRLDPFFGRDGRLMRDGVAWESPEGAVPDGAGGLFVWSALALQRVTGDGRVATGFGAGGQRWLSDRRQVLRWGAGRVLVAERTTRGGRVSDRVRIFDRRGREVSERAGTAFGVALTQADRAHESRWLMATPDRRALLDLSLRDQRNALRTFRADGTTGPRHRIVWPGALPFWAGPSGSVLSGGRVLVVAGGGVSPRRLVALTPGGRIDRTWGTSGQARLHDPVRVLLAWRGGAIAVGADHTTWIDRRGRVVARRSLRADAAAVDAFGRLLVARPSPTMRSISVLRLDGARRVDARFGRHVLHAEGHALPVAVVPDGRHRVSVVARGTLAPEDVPDIREDIDDDVVVHGTSMWRMTDR